MVFISILNLGIKMIEKSLKIKPIQCQNMKKDFLVMVLQEIHRYFKFLHFGAGAVISLRLRLLD